MPGGESTAFVVCPLCRVPLAVPSDLVSRVVYPDDFDIIGDICYGRFNTRPHQCGGTVTFAAPAFAVHRDTMETIWTDDPSEDIRQSLNAKGWLYSVVDDYNGLAYGVMKWMERDSGSYWSSLQDGSLPELSLREATDRMSPIQLLAFKMLRDRLIGLLVIPETDPARTPVPTYDEEVLDRVARSGTRLTVSHLKGVVQLAVFDGLGGQLEEAVAEQVPTDCLDDEVLELLVSDAESASSPESPGDVLEMYNLLLACALAHRLVGRDNPAASQLAVFLAGLYEFALRDDVEFDEKFWLTPVQLRRLLDPLSALGAAAELCRSEEWFLLSGKSREFLDRLGWLELITTFYVTWVDREGKSLQKIHTPPVVQALLAAALRRRESGLDDWELGYVLAGAAFQWIRTGLPIDEQELLDSLADGLGEQASPVARYAFQVGVIENVHMDHHLELAHSAAVEVLQDFSTVDVGPERAAHALVEVGNTFRYQQRWGDALELYEYAATFSRLVPEGQEERDVVLARNRALVLRDMGRFSEAESILEGLARNYPDNCEIQESLVLLHERTGRRKEALKRVEEQLARNDLHPFDTSRFKLIRAQLRAWSGQHDAAAADCREAISIQTRPWSRLQAEMCALLTEPEDEQLAAFVADCERNIAALLDRQSLGNPHMAITAATLAALRRLRAGEVTAAGKLLVKIEEWLHWFEFTGSWQFSLAVGWHAMKTGEAGAFTHLSTAVAKLNAWLPMTSEADHAVGALANFAIDDLHRLAVHSGVDSITVGQSEPADLVPVLDVANGRDLTARASVNARLPDAGPPTVEALDRWQETSQVDVIAVVDNTPTVQLLVQPAAGRRRLVDTAIPLSELRTAVHALRAFEFTNPLAPQRMDDRLAPWWDFGAALAAVIRRELPGNQELVVVPGPQLVATPLHAAGWPDRPLIADRPVSVSPNHRLLAGRPSLGNAPPRTTPCGLIAVPKASDTTDFTDKLTSFTARFRSRAPHAQVISMAEADETASLALLAQAEMALLLCHGVHGGPDLGPGICVAAASILPPSYLDVTADPDLAAFVLSWDDVAQLPHSPDLVVSIACSSGRTVVGAGGSRLGLEHGTLANSTRFVVAPLWPVEQHTSLTWVEAFLEPLDLVTASDDRSLRHLPEIHRSTTLALADQHPHPYHWAPFALTTALRGGIQ